jgi:hypothetical protein
MDVAIGLGLLVFLGLVGVGYIVGTAVSTQGVASGTISTPTTSCDDFCKAWQGARSDVCMARSNLASASAWFNTCQNASYYAAASAAAASLAAWVAAAVPLFGPAIAGPLFIIASGLVIAAASAYTAMIGAGIAMTARASDLNNAQTAAIAARAKVMSSCAGDALTNCMAMPAPCPGV